MSREKGLASFSANFEPQMAAPLDARAVVATLADLTTAATWEANDGGTYTYLGMLVTVTSDATSTNNGTYRLTEVDYTQSASWEKTGSGGTGTIPDGTTTGDIVRWNAVSGAWESSAEPLDFKQINLTPATSAVENTEGGVFYKSTDKAVYVCTEDS